MAICLHGVPHCVSACQESELLYTAIQSTGQVDQSVTAATLPSPCSRTAIPANSPVRFVSTLNCRLLTVSCNVQWPGFCKNLFEFSNLLKMIEI